MSTDYSKANLSPSACLARLARLHLPVPFVVVFFPAVRHKRQMTSLCFLVTDNHTGLFAYTEQSDMSDLLHSK